MIRFEFLFDTPAEMTRISANNAAPLKSAFGSTRALTLGNEHEVASDKQQNNQAPEFKLHSKSKIKNNYGLDSNFSLEVVVRAQPYVTGKGGQ